MKLYADYILERLGQDMVLIPDIGFATFQIKGKTCFIVDIFVKKEYRKAGYASVMADDISQIAKRKGCNLLIGTVLDSANNSEASHKVLKAYGMRLGWYDKKFDMFYYKKDL